MPSSNSSNKTLAKNTLFLYFRMLFLMAISLYTSRVTLRVLGVDDFGVYNIVSGVVVLFAFLSTFLTSACNRFFSVAVGDGDEKNIQKVFSTSLVAHVFLILLAIVLLESVGLWFVAYKLNIPVERKPAALVIYQIAIITTCLSIIKIPFHSSVIANERMSFYAYTSIIEGVFKLIVVWLLIIIPFDKLISYSVLLAAVIFIIDIWYILYCTNKFKGNRIIFKTDKAYLRQMMTFSGWSLFDGVAAVGWEQGTNIILNMFYGVALNTSLGISNQVRHAVYSFVSNLQTAANPQIIKTYSSNNISRFGDLVLSISKYSFYLMLFFATPLIINMEYVLHLWLGVVPEYSVAFVSLILVYCTIDSLTGPLWTSIQATGDIKVYSIIVSCILLLNLPATYFLFKLGFPPQSMMCARIVLLIVSLIWIIIYSHAKVGLDLISYTRKVILPVFLITLLSVIPSFYLSSFFNGFTKLTLSLLLNTFLLVLLIYVIGIEQRERRLIKEYILSKLRKR